MLRARDLIFILSAAACSAEAQLPAPDPVNIFIGRVGETCPVRIEGRTYSIPGDSDRLEVHFEQLRRSGKTAVRIIGDIKVPYRCVGGIIFLAQRMQMTVGFVAAPPEFVR